MSVKQPLRRNPKDVAKFAAFILAPFLLALGIDVALHVL